MNMLYTLARRASRTVGSDSALVRTARPYVERVLRWTAGRRGLAWEINGLPCRINPALRAQLAHNYDEHLFEYLRGKIRPGQTCLDVGANVGAWMLQFAALVGPSGRVAAFEPNPAARAYLEDHVRLNGLERTVQIVPAAVGAGVGELQLFVSGADGMSRLGAPNPFLTAPTQTIAVPVTTLDVWCRDHQVEPDWLLIDVEGFEGGVLAGAAEVIRRRGSALGILIEMHPNLWATSGMTAAAFVAQLAALGRRAVPLSGQADWLNEYGHVALEL